MLRGTAVGFLFTAFAASFLACGGRTDMDVADGGTGGFASSLGGDSAASGSSSLSGAAGVGGSPSAGAPGAGGAPSAGGAAHAGSPSVGGAPGVAGSPASGGVSGDIGEGGTSSVIVDACVAIAQSACNKCLCQACSDAVIGCFSDIGCASILACFEQTGCQGPNCYSVGACQGVIKRYGGLMGHSATKVFAVASCSLSSQKACACN